MSNVIYDFDGTLTKSSLPYYEAIENSINLYMQTLFYYFLHFKKMNVYEAYYHMYLCNLERKNTIITPDVLSYGANSVAFRDDVINFFENNDSNHFIITSGLKQFVLETKIGG